MSAFLNYKRAPLCNLFALALMLLATMQLSAQSPTEVFQQPELLLQQYRTNPVPLEAYNETEIAWQHTLNAAEDSILAYMPVDKVERTPVDFEPITPWTWKWVHLTHQQPNGTTSTLSLRRPNWWLDMVGAEFVGDSIWLDLPEMGIAGQATVTAITPNQLDTRLWDQQRNGDYVILPITGKFTHHASEILKLQFAQGNAEVEVTGRHPFRSETQNDWVPAEALAVGEVVRTHSGMDTLLAKTTEPGAVPVYNIEVYRAHNYFVHDQALLVHNNSGWIVKNLYSKMGSPRLKEARYALEEAMQNGLVESKNAAGIKYLKGGKKVDGVTYFYEVKTAPGSRFSSHRLYGNKGPWTNPQTGETVERIFFSKHKPK